MLVILVCKTSESLKFGLNTRFTELVIENPLSCFNLVSDPVNKAFY